MTQEDATKVLNQLRLAVKGLNPMVARQAFTALMGNPRVFTTGAMRAAEAGDAVQTLMRSFDEIERGGVQFPPK